MIDEAAVRDALSPVVREGEVAEIVIEGDWVCVALAQQPWQLGRWQ